MKEFEVRFEGELPATPHDVWEAVTLHTTGWLWGISYEQRVGGAERGLSPNGGTVTVWEPPRHFATRAEGSDGWFNILDYALEPRTGGTFMRYVHTSVLPEDSYDVELDACRKHTALYNHTLAEYLRHFKGREAAYASADGPEVSARPGAFAALRRGLGLGEGAATGDRVRLTPDGPEAIDGVIDYATPEFLGVRSGEALYRFFGRDAFGWPVGVALHLFGDGGDVERAGEAWRVWLDGLFDDGRSEG
jgi:uncharacterized protein YndB with AHSA1/START domain